MLGASAQLQLCGTRQAEQSLPPSCPASCGTDCAALNLALSQLGQALSCRLAGSVVRRRPCYSHEHLLDDMSTEFRQSLSKVYQVALAKTRIQQRSSLCNLTLICAGQTQGGIRYAITLIVRLQIPKDTHGELSRRPWSCCCCWAHSHAGMEVPLNNLSRKSLRGHLQ